MGRRQMLFLFGVLLASFLGEAEQLNCANPCLPDEVCTSNNGVAKCICNQTLYLHANRNDLVPNAMCKTTVMRLEFSKCLLERFHYDYKNMHLLDDSIYCSGLFLIDIVNNMRVVVIEPLIRAGTCGSIATVNEGKVTYSNALYIPSDNSTGIIYSKPLNYTFSCTYNLTMQTSLGTAIHPVVTTVVLPFGIGTGSANATMVAYINPTYTIPYTEGYVLNVGDRIYIGIFTDFADGETFSLRAENCSASPTTDGLNPVQLISGGCAVDQGTSTLVESNGQSLEVRFSLEMLTFQDQSQVFMFCKVRLCQKGMTSTCTGCANGANGRADDGTVEMKVGPLDLQGTDSSGTHSAVSWTLLGSSLLALLSLKMM